MNKNGGVIDLVVEDYKKIKNLRVKLFAGLNQIGGPNGAGKSSGLEAISNIFGGKRLTPPKPVREGAKGYKLQLTLPKLGLLIKRVGTLDKEGRLSENLIITNASGATAGEPVARPQEILKRLLNGFSVTLQSLLEMPKMQQLSFLQKIAGLDFTALDSEKEKLYASRTEANSLVKRLKARLEAQPEIEGVPKEPISAADLLDELREREAINAANYSKRQEVKGLEAQATAIEDDCARLEGEIARLQEDLAKLEATKKKVYSRLDDVSGSVKKLVDADVDEVKEQLRAADGINTQVRSNKARAQLFAELAIAEKSAATLDGKLSELAAKKESMLAAAKFPVKGLVFDDEGVYLNGLPLEQASQVEQMQVDVALAIAQSPKVPMILINKGSLYDKEHRDALDRIAKEHGVYVVFERVLESLDEAEAEDVAVYMQDGVGVDLRAQGAGDDGKENA